MKALSVFTLLFSLTGTAAYADCGKIEITEFDFSSAQVNAQIAKFILEQGYGCEVALVPSSTTSAIASISATGKPDVLTEIWENAAGVLREMQGNGEVTFLQNVLSEGGQQGWWVPKYLVDEHPELATIEGILANPDLVGGRFYSCPDGWTCNFTNGHIAEAYDLEGAGIEVFVPGGGEVLATSLASAYADRQPWLGYYWAPSPLLGENPMVLVDLGPYDPEAFSCNATEDCKTPGKTSYSQDDVWTIVTTSLTEREPEATEMLSRMAFTNQELGAVLAWQEANSASAEETAVYFLTNYQDVWADWINDSARENLSALLK